MRTNLHSKAKIAGHPIHPMLVHFPIALFLGGVLSLLAFMGIGDLFWYRVAAIAFIAGAVTAVAAAIPGMIDLFGAIPRGSDARRTGVNHMGLNLIAVIVFGAAGIMMYRSFDMHTTNVATELSVTLPLVLSLVGAAILAVSGTLGSKLVHKLNVGQHIDDRGLPANVPERSGTVRGDVGRPAY